MTRRKHASPRWRGVLRLLGRNALLLAAGVALVALAGEAWFRLTVPFPRSSDEHRVFVPNVGYLRPPDMELRHTNGVDFWNVSRTNSLGFLDREPPRPEDAAATCHVTMIGDSFVDAKEVPIRDKLQVRLEELAASRLLHLNVTTSAFGMENTGQVQQFPFYDEYARKLRPKLLVLVFVDNDFLDNSPVLQAITWGWDPEHLPHTNAKKRPDGTMELRLPDPDGGKIRLPVLRGPLESLVDRVTEVSWFAVWLRAKQRVWYHPSRRPTFVGPRGAKWAEMLSQRPRYAALLEGWQSVEWIGTEMLHGFDRGSAWPLVFDDALDYTAFALEQFKQRADRDGAKLAILATHTLKVKGTHLFERLGEMAATLAIPVIDQADYILRQGAKFPDARWPHDGHWNPAGHQWAAEALLEYIEENQEICDGPVKAQRLRSRMLNGEYLISYHSLDGLSSGMAGPDRSFDTRMEDPDSDNEPGQRPAERWEEGDGVESPAHGLAHS